MTTDLLSIEFERHRPRMRAVAYRMLGSLTDADDAVQEAWLRFSRAGIDGVENVGAWLTTIVSRVSLNLLQARANRREEPLSARVPDPVVTRPGPEDDAVLADSIGLALLVVLDSLNPDERLAFVLHDLFAVPFDEIAAVLNTTPGAARQLASRARRRVRGASPADHTDAAQQRQLVDAFLAASREGDFAALVAILDARVVFRLDAGGRADRAREPVTGPDAVARRVLARGRPFAHLARPAMVNGAPGLLVAARGAAMAVVGFTCAHGRIVAIDLIADPEKLRHLDVRPDPGDSP